MKKKTVAAMLVMCMALSATACGGSDTKETKTETTQDTGDKKDSASSDKKTSASAVRLVSVSDVSKYVTIGEYKGLTLDRASVTVTDDDVQAEIDYNLEENGTEVNDGTVEEGDSVTINFTGTIDGKESVAGKPVEFKVTLQKFTRPSELNDEWVAANTEYKTVDEYRAAVKKELEENETKSADYDLYSNAWSEVLANSEVKEYPEEDVDKAVEAYKKLNENYVKEAGMEMSDFLKAQGMSEEDYEEDCQQYAESKVEQNLIVQGIMDAEGLSLDDDDIQTLKDELLSEYGYESFDQLVAYYGEQEVNESLALMRVERFIVDNATVNETSATEADVANEDADPESEDTGVDAAEDTTEDNASEEDSSDTAEESEETASEDDVANEG